jgi:hypothetical protein
MLKQHKVYISQEKTDYVLNTLNSESKSLHFIHTACILRVVLGLGLMLSLSLETIGRV